MSIGDDLLVDGHGPSTEKLERIVKRALRRLEVDGLHPLAPAGLKLKELRIQSGWTVEDPGPSIAIDPHG